jgi:hypothetical protein
MTSRQYFNLHARLHAERDWPHRHRRLHRNEEEILAKEPRIPLAQLHAANAKGGMFDLTRLPSDEMERREKVLGLASHGRYVYTVNAGRLRTLHRSRPKATSWRSPQAWRASCGAAGCRPTSIVILTPSCPRPWKATTRRSSNSSIIPSSGNALMTATSSTSGAWTVSPAPSARGPGRDLRQLQAPMRLRAQRRPPSPRVLCHLEATATRWPMHRVRVHHLRGEPDSTCQQPVTTLTS